MHFIDLQTFLCCIPSGTEYEIRTNQEPLGYKEIRTAMS